jgi:predicted ester cyclase
MVIERMLREGFASGDTSVVDELCSPDLVEHQFGLAGIGHVAIEKIKNGMTQVHSAFPDLHFTVQGSATEGDVAWVCAEGTGTNTGPFLGAPTGLPVRFTVIDVARIVDGRIVEHWGVPDRFAILAQLGRLVRPD